MAAAAVPATTAEVADLHTRVTRFVFANFHRKLTFDEAGDVAAEAIGEADRAAAAGQRIANLDAWLRTASWRNAVSAIRRIEGEGRERRQRPADISEQGEWLLDERLPQEEVVSRHGERDERQALVRAWSRLARDEQRALYLRYFDELPVEDVLAVLGCSRHHYENLTKRALRKLRDALVAGVHDAGCRACRAAVVDAKLAPLAPAQAAERDAHLSACLHCRAFERRQRGLIAVLPLPAVGLVERLTARLHALGQGGSDAAHSGEAAAGAAGLAGAGAIAGTGAAGAGGLLTAAGAAKTIAVLCSAGAVTAGVCVTAAPSPKPERPEPRAQSAPARKAPTARPAVRPVVAVAATAPSKPAPSPAATPEAGPSTRAAHEDRAAARERTEAARRASSPFLPESAAPAASTSPPAKRATTFSASAAAQPADRSSASAPAASRTAFSQEFTP